MRRDRWTDRRQVLVDRARSMGDGGITRQLSRASVRRARLQLLLLLPLAAGILFVYNERRTLAPGYELPIRIGTVLVLLAAGWGIARSIGRALGSSLFARLEPGTAGTVGFLVRLLTIVLAAVVALHIAGVNPRDLALGGAFTAVIVGLAAQQTLGNLFAGTVLLSARPFRVGDRVRLQGGGLAGSIEGIVNSLGLLYTEFTAGEDLIMVPNTVVLNVAVVPLREPDAVDLRARLRPGVTPQDIQSLLDERLETPVRDQPRIMLEELDGDEVVVRIRATPHTASDGPRLAGEVLRAVSAETRRVTQAETDGSGTDGDRPTAGVAV